MNQLEDWQHNIVNEMGGMIDALLHHRGSGCYCPLYTTDKNEANDRMKWVESDIIPIMINFKLNLKLDGNDPIFENEMYWVKLIQK